MKLADFSDVPRISSRHLVPGFLCLVSLLSCVQLVSLNNSSFLWLTANKFDGGSPNTSIM